jgi:hypothetical protein
MVTSEEVPVMTELVLADILSRSSSFVLVIASLFLFAWINGGLQHGER